MLGGEGVNLNLLPFYNTSINPPAIVEQRRCLSHEEFMSMAREALHHLEVINEHLRRINGRDMDTQGG